MSTLLLSPRFWCISELALVFLLLINVRFITDQLHYLSKTSQIIFDLHPGFSHMEDEKGNKLHLFKKYFKMIFFIIQAIIGPYCYSF